MLDLQSNESLFVFFTLKHMALFNLIENPLSPFWFGMAVVVYLLHCVRSEERRGGKECSSRWGADH